MSRRIIKTLERLFDVSEDPLDICRTRCLSFRSNNIPGIRSNEKKCTTRERILKAQIYIFAYTDAVRGIIFKLFYCGSRLLRKYAMCKCFK